MDQPQCMPACKGRKKVWATSAYQRAVCSVAASHRKLGAEFSKIWPYKNTCFRAKDSREAEEPGNRGQQESDGALHGWVLSQIACVWELPMSLKPEAGI